MLLNHLGCVGRDRVHCRPCRVHPLLHRHCLLVWPEWLVVQRVVMAGMHAVLVTFQVGCVQHLTTIGLHLLNLEIGLLLIGYGEHGLVFWSRTQVRGYWFLLTLAYGHELLGVGAGFSHLVLCLELGIRCNYFLRHFEHWLELLVQPFWRFHGFVVRLCSSVWIRSHVECRSLVHVFWFSDVHCLVIWCTF